MTNTQKLAVLGVVGPIMFVLGIAIAGTQYDGYSHIKQEISQLGGVGSEYAWIQNLNFYLFSLTVMGFTFAVHRAIGGGKGSVLGPVLIGYFGLSSAGFNGIFPCDALCEGITASGKLHLITGITGFLSMIIGLIVISRRMTRLPEWKIYSRYTLASGIIAIVLFLAIGATDGSDAELDGLMQRLFVTPFLLWIFLTGLRIVSDNELSRPD
jgi:hypothetical membrane protein